MLKKSLLIVALLCAPLIASAQVFSQNQVIIPPFGSNGFVVSTTTGFGGKLQATTTPYFANYFAGNATINNLVVTTCTGCGTGGGGTFPFTPTSYGNATNTTLGLLQGFTSPASSTIAGPFHLGLSNGGLGINGGLVYAGATTTAGTGLSYSGNAFNVTGLTTTQFASPNISQWTNDAGYITSASSFSTTSANYWASLGLAFSTTSDNYNFNVALAATTSVKSIVTLSSLSLPYSQLTGTPTIPTLLSQLTNDVGFVTSSFSTTSANFWSSLGLGFSTTSANYWKTQTTFTGASTTLLGDTNTFSGNDTFNNLITGSISGNAGTATALQNARTINGVSFNGTANIVVASTTLLGDFNTFTGQNMLLASTTIGNGASTGGLTISGNATTTGQTFHNGNVGIFKQPTVSLDVLGGGTNQSVAIFSGSNSNNSNIMLANTATGGRTFSLFSTANGNSLGGGKFIINDNTGGGARLIVDLNGLVSLPTNASTTQFSSFTKSYFGAQATTTIDNNGNIVIPSGSNLTITGKTDGCATFATGVLNSTGSACGSGGGSVGNWFTPTTFGVTTANATSTLTGFTAGLYALASSTIGSGLQAGGLTISGGATTTGNMAILNSLVIGTSTGALSNVNANNGNLFLYNTNTAGGSPAIMLGGNNGGDTDFWMARQNNNDTINNDFLQFGSGLVPGTNTMLTLDNQGRLGIGSTTPWALLSVASSTLSDYTLPIFAVATSSDPFGQLMSVFSTTTEGATNARVGTSIADMISNGVRVVIGNWLQARGSALDQVNVNGRINTGDWEFMDCQTGLGTIAQITSDAASVCGQWALQIDTNGGYYSNSGLGAGSVNRRAGFLLAGAGGAAATGVGSGLFGIGLITAAGLGFADVATSTPVFETALTLSPTAVVNTGVITTVNSATSTLFAGLTNIPPSGTSFETAPTVGCYFTASSTQNNFMAVCSTSAAAMTILDTGIASTSRNYTRLRIEMDATKATFYTQSTTTTMVKVGTISGANYPSGGTATLIPAIIIARPSAGLSASVLFPYMHFWYRNTLWPEPY